MTGRNIWRDRARIYAELYINDGGLPFKDLLRLLGDLTESNLRTDLAWFGKREIVQTSKPGTVLVYELVVRDLTFTVPICLLELIEALKDYEHD